jgi:hypothetical protein
MFKYITYVRKVGKLFLSRTSCLWTAVGPKRAKFRIEGRVGSSMTTCYKHLE